MDYQLTSYDSDNKGSLPPEYDKPDRCIGCNRDLTQEEVDGDEDGLCTLCNQQAQDWQEAQTQDQEYADNQ